MWNKIFCRYCLHVFITEGILNTQFKDFFKTNAQQTVKMPKNDEYVKFKNIEG